MKNTHLATQKAIFDNCATNLKIGCKTFLRKPYVTKFHGYVYNTFSKYRKIEVITFQIFGNLYFVLLVLLYVKGIRMTRVST